MSFEREMTSSVSLGAKKTREEGFLSFLFVWRLGGVCGKLRGDQF